MSDTQGLVLSGLERMLVHNRVRAAAGLRWEIPGLLRGVAVTDGSLCLEIGTGFGWGTLGLVRQTPGVRVIATDYDASVLPEARAYIRRHAPAARVAFCQANAKRLPFADSSFDLVLALYVLHHVAGYRPALHEIARVLKPGGRFLFIDVVMIPFLPGLKRLMPPAGLLTQAKLASFLAEAGLRVERWRGVPGRVAVVAVKSCLPCDRRRKRNTA